ncbi:exosortase F system-associated membrane protein [Aequorivita echinoideorum]|uniref:Exosortase F system-associated protein n=1 Tax=Aequorivita echinoideorum TaxID=1549647 RepID=A0ABS5S274_9FLAO|nr:exosortase F system-associated protein [Aequorivita echinoideorum]MBT0607309.1 exosortase F system-associated protein [Aequorivita echinoideorum]
MEKALRIILLVLLFGTLVLVRAFEDSLFYDPLLNFFKSDSDQKPLPEMDTFALQANIAFRFLINTLISLAIIFVIFRERGIVKLSAVLYAWLFAILFLAFSFIIFTSEEVGTHMLLFYVRRFLIQPILLLVLLPAFYFQKKN